MTGMLSGAAKSFARLPFGTKIVTAQGNVTD
jgi:hypothetical protein